MLKRRADQTRSSRIHHSSAAIEDFISSFLAGLPGVVWCGVNEDCVDCFIYYFSSAKGTLLVHECSENDNL